MSEADTCRKFVVPRLQTAGWEGEPRSIAEQRTITDGRIVSVGQGFRRRPMECSRRSSTPRCSA
jgi:type I restriction enzyme R subunit